MLLQATYSILLWGIFNIGNIKVVRTKKEFILKGKLHLIFKNVYVYYYQNQTNYFYYEKDGKKKRNRKWVFYLGKILYHQNYTSNLVLGHSKGKIIKTSKNGYICYKFTRGDVKLACVKLLKVDNFTFPAKVKLEGKFPSMYIKLKSYKITN